MAEQIQKIFGTQAADTIAVLQNKRNMDSLLASVKTSSGSAGAVLREWGPTKKALDNTMASIGVIIINIITPMENYFEYTNEWVLNNKELVSTIFAVVSIVGGLILNSVH